MLYHTGGRDFVLGVSFRRGILSVRRNYRRSEGSECDLRWHTDCRDASYTSTC